MALTGDDNTNSASPAQSSQDDEQLALANLSQADLQALAEKVMALLKRDLRLERERLIGR
jgi:hypothetical protein